MKTLLKWVAPNATMTLRPEGSQTVYMQAAGCIQERLENGGDLELFAIDVEDRVSAREHSTGIKSFDALLRKNQGTFITGNVYGDAQLSQYVRGINDIECNGFKFAPGVLRTSDLKIFQKDGPNGMRHFTHEFMPVKRWLDEHPEGDVILYSFRNRAKSRLMDRAAWHPYGFLVTDPQHNLLFRSHDLADKNANNVLNEAEHFLTNRHHQNVTPLVRLKAGCLELLTPQMQAAYDLVAECDLVVERPRG